MPEPPGLGLARWPSRPCRSSARPAARRRCAVEVVTHRPGVGRGGRGHAVEDAPVAAAGAGLDLPGRAVPMLDQGRFPNFPARTHRPGVGGGGGGHAGGELRVGAGAGLVLSRPCRSSARPRAGPVAVQAAPTAQALVEEVAATLEVVGVWSRRGWGWARPSRPCRSNARSGSGPGAVGVGGAHRPRIGGGGGGDRLQGGVGTRAGGGYDGPGGAVPVLGQRGQPGGGLGESRPPLCVRGRRGGDRLQDRARPGSGRARPSSPRRSSARSADRIRRNSWVLPTAHTSLAEVAVTDSRLSEVPGSGLGTSVQLDPSQCSVSVVGAAAVPP